MPRGYAPERGDLVWIDFNPQAGHEQAGRRPAVVLSPSSYNRKVGLAILCPVTNQRKGYPFEVAIPGLKAPADIGYDTKRGRVLVPLFQDSAIEAYEQK